MNETKHTAGPWHIQRYRNFVGYSIWASGRGCIAERWYPSEQEQPYGDEIGANAALIVSAPDGLALAKTFDVELAQAVEHLRRSPNDPSDFDLAETLDDLRTRTIEFVARATGKAT